MITCHVIKMEEIRLDMLDFFERTQWTSIVLVNIDGTLVEKQDAFEDDWTFEKKREIVQHFKKTIVDGGAVVVAMQDSELIGFAVLEAEIFGRDVNYRELSYFHVTQSARGMKVGEALFNNIKEVAKSLGADKLYIGAHPSVETQSFYRKMGCVIATEINERIYQREIRDIQLEIEL